MVLGYSESGHQINDEKITAQQQVTLAHDNFFDVEIWTGPNKTGTKLVEGTDYVLSKFDARYNAWNEIRFLAHIGETLYVTYKSRGDYIKAEHVNDLKSSKAEKDLSNVQDADILNKIKNVDGEGSGLDADTLDGLHASDFAHAVHTHTTADITDINTTHAKVDLSNVDNNVILTKLTNVDGSGSRLDADTLDGLHATDFVQQDSAGNVIISGNLETAGDTIVKGINVLKTFPPAIPEGSTAYFKKQLIDEIIGIKPDGYDGSTVTSYGLRTSSDNATLVVTERKDDVPFPGVTSFAVEEGTTNYCTKWANGSFEDGTQGANISGWYLGYLENVKSASVVYGQGYRGLGADVTLTTEETAQTASGQAYVGFEASASTSPGVVLTFQFKYKILSGGDKLYNETRLQCYDADGKWLGNIGGSGTEYTLPDGWRLRVITATTLANTSTVKGQVRLGCTVNSTIRYLVDEIQLEQKPFATSFTEGTRPRGRFHIPLDRLGFDPATDNWVVAYWKKPIAGHDGTQSGQNLGYFGYYTPNLSVGYIYWGKWADANTFMLYAAYNDGTGVRSSTKFDPQWYWSNWHFEIIKREGNIISFYVDGVLQCQVTLTKPLQSFNYGLSLACHPGQVHTSLLANILLSRDPSVWTDEYIKFLYETQKPFFV